MMAFGSSSNVVGLSSGSAPGSKIWVTVLDTLRRWFVYWSPCWRHESGRISSARSVHSTMLSWMFPRGLAMSWPFRLTM